MTTDTQRVETFLSHINQAGKRSFDEASVKRDKGGQFSTKAANAGKLSKEDLAKLLDKGWDANMLANMQAIMDANEEAMTKAVEKLAASAGVTDPEKFWKNDKLAAKGMQAAADVLNKAVPNTFEGVSTSGTQRLEFIVRPDFQKHTSTMPLTVRKIPYSGVNPHPATTQQLSKQIRQTRRLDSKDAAKSGFHFNPNAVLDPSRVHSVGHTDVLRVQKFLEHYGRRGMKWGQRIFSRGSSSSSSSSDAASTSSDASSSSSSSSSTNSSSGIKSTKDLAELSDAQKAKAVAAKAKKSGVDSLTNQEMQVLVNRLNLEQQYSKFKHQNSSINKGREFANRQLKTGKTINEMISFYNSPTGRLLSSFLSPTSAGKHTLGKRHQGTHIKIT